MLVQAHPTVLTMSDYQGNQGTLTMRNPHMHSLYPCQTLVYTRNWVLVPVLKLAFIPINLYKCAKYCGDL